MRKVKLIRCECCKRPMRPGDEYFMIDGKIICNRFECGIKTGRWEINLLNGRHHLAYMTKNDSLREC